MNMQSLMNWKPTTSACLWQGWARAVVSIVLLGTLPTRLAALTIARPNFGVPEFVVSGGVIRVEVKHAAGLNSGQWSAVLMNDLQAWTATVELAQYGTYVDNNTVAGYRLTVRVPPGAPPEVHRLVIAHPVGGTATNKNAVSILTSMEADFYIMHYADPQAESVDPNNWDTGMYGTHGSLLELEWHAPGIRLANPRFLFDTGDELDNNFATKANYEHHQDHLCGMGVPVLATRGNNDILTATDWRATFGVETYSITMGSFYICQKDYNEDNYSTWLQNDYAASFANPAIKFRLFGQHFNSGGKAWLPPAGQSPGLMLVGHGHINQPLQSSPYPILETQQACNKGAVGFFNFDKTASGWTCTNLGSPWFQMMSSGATGRLRAQYAVTNNGTATANSATITNELAANFYDGRVRFLMRHAAMGYQVTGGQILARYAYNSGSSSAVLVKVDIPASGNAAVSISRIDANDNGMPDAWEVTCFGSTTNPLGAADSDWDHDGQDNLHEYLAGTSPTDPLSVFKITSVAMDASGKLVLQWLSVAGKSYGIQTATDLLAGFHDTGGAPIPGTGGIVTKTVTAGSSPTGFYRVFVIP
ncbi:MAG: hypothetical protein NTW21_27530 [Verrucomicrobia bacterium]|nr:hypothetical protein [Verrucomicrobiota bacterium]